MKLRKRIAALGAAMTMAVSMMSIGASAYSSTQSWGVRYMPSAPTSVNVYSCDNIFASSSTLYSFQENCTSKNNNANYHGDVSKVSYAGYVLYNDGNREKITSYFSWYIQDNNYKTIPLNMPVTNAYKLVVNNHLYHNNLYTTFNGNVRA